MISLPEIISTLSATILLLHLLDREHERKIQLRQDLPHHKKKGLKLLTWTLWWTGMLSVALLASWIFIIPWLEYFSGIALMLYGYQILTEKESRIESVRPRTYLALSPALSDQVRHMVSTHIFGAIMLGMIFSGPSRWLIVSCILAAIAQAGIGMLPRKFSLKKIVVGSLLLAVISIWWYRL